MTIKLFQNPELAEKDKHYETFEDLLQGEHAIMVSEKYLPYHELEKQKDASGISAIRQTRESLSRYTNFPSRILRRYQSIIFQEDPKLDDATQELLGDLQNNIDGVGTSIVEFIKQKHFKNRFCFGDSALLTTSQNDAPIWDSLSARTVKDWAFEDGKLSLFRYEYCLQEPRTSSTVEPKVIIYSDEYSLSGNVVYSTRYQAEASKDKARELSWVLKQAPEVVTNFTAIPVALLFGDSFLKDSSSEILTYHNLKSSLLNVLYHQAFQKIIITGAIDSDQKIAFAEYVATILRTTDGGTASVTNIEPSNPQALTDQVKASEMSVYKAAFHLNRMLSSDSGNTEGQSNQQEAKQDLLNMIKTEILALERQVNQGLNDIATQLGKKNFTGKITFFKEVNIQSVDEMLKDELAYREDARKYPTWDKALLKKAVDRQEYADDIEEQIFKEIDAGATTTATVTPTPVTLNNVS